MSSEKFSDTYFVWQRLATTLLTPEEETEQYDILEGIGEGGFSEVSMVQRKSDGVKLAMKRVKFNATDAKNKDLQREIFNIVTIDSHENIVQWTDIFRSPTHLCIVMELCDMDLTKFMGAPSNRKFSVCLDIAKQIATGIAILHNRNSPLIHRDIKPQNILIEINPKTAKVSVKIADFGLSSGVDFNVTQESDGVKPNDRSRSNEILMSSIGVHGTLPFMAPEMFAAKDGHGLVNGRFRPHVSGDIFALGLVYAYVFFYNDGNYVSYIRQGFCESLGQDMLEAEENKAVMPVAVEIEHSDSSEVKEIKQLIRDMTSFDTKQRPSSQQVLQQVTNIQAKLQIIKPPARLRIETNRRCKIKRRRYCMALVAGVITILIAFFAWPTGKHTHVWNKAADLALNAAVHNGHCSFIGALLYLGADVEATVLNSGLTPLHHACHNGHLRCVHELLSHGANIEAETAELHETPLYLAGRYNQNDIVKALLGKYKASVRATRLDGYTALHLAAMYGRPETIRTLLMYSNIDVNIMDIRGRTALHHACKEGNDECIHPLVKHGANVEAKDESGKTPLHLAAMSNQIRCAKTLIEKYNANINAIGKGHNTALHLATSSGNIDMIELLLSYPKTDINAQGWHGYSALHFACRFDQAETIGVLVKHGANVEARCTAHEDTALHVAAWFNQNSCARALLENNASVNAANRYGHTALQLAARRGNAGIIKTLLSHADCDVNIKDHEGKTALHDAAIYKRTKCMKLLITHGADIEARSNNGFTPLLSAARSNQIEVVKSLVEAYNASRTAVSADGSTVLHLAALNSDRELIRVLFAYAPFTAVIKDSRGKTPLHLAVEHGLCLICIIDLARPGNVNLMDNHGLTALHLAVSGGKYETAVNLLKKGAAINARDNSKQTPLHKAAAIGNITLMRFLTSRPMCDVKAKDANGKTAADIARQKGFYEFVKYFDAV